MAILGIDLAVRAAHVATLADDKGKVVWGRRRFHNRRCDLAALSEAAGPATDLTVVMEPTRNSWVLVAAHFKAAGAKVVLVPPEQSADLRRYYSKHTKNDRLDSEVLARLPLLHPEGLAEVADLGPADALKRAVRRRAKLVAERLACCHRLDALLDLLGPGYHEALGVLTCKSSLEVIERYGDPRQLRRLGQARLTALLKKLSAGQRGNEQAEGLLAAANEAIALWQGGGLDFAELAWDLASEVRIVRQLDQELERLDNRIADLYAAADPKGIVISAPGIGPVLAGGILGRLGDPSRFANLAAVRSFSGMVPAVDQSGRSQSRPGITRQGDSGLRRDIWLAAEVARHKDPQLAAKYYRLVVGRQLHHHSAVCHVATTLLTRVAACWRSGQPYVLRDTDGREVAPVEAKAIIATRFKVPKPRPQAPLGVKSESEPGKKGVEVIAPAQLAPPED